MALFEVHTGRSFTVEVPDLLAAAHFDHKGHTNATRAALEAFLSQAVDRWIEDQRADSPEGKHPMYRWCQLKPRPVTR